MSFLRFKYNLEDVHSVQTSIESFPQPERPSGGLGAIFTGYVSQEKGYFPIYDEDNIKIGYATYEDNISNLGYNQKIYVSETATYFIEDKGSITYTYSWEADNNSGDFTPGTTVATRILASTQNYYNKSGPIAINVGEDGSRRVTIVFNT